MPSKAPSPSVIAMRRRRRPPPSPSGSERGVRSAEIAGPSGLVRVGKYVAAGGRAELRAQPRRRAAEVDGAFVEPVLRDESLARGAKVARKNGHARLPRVAILGGGFVDDRREVCWTAWRDVRESLGNRLNLPQSDL